MASLTQTAILARKAIRYTIYLIIFIIIARFVIRGTLKVYRTIFPPAPPPPTIRFGKLAKIPFPEKTLPTVLNYVLETPDGRLPQFPDQTEVYFMPPVLATLHSLEQAKNKAGALRFDPNGKPIVESIPNVYIFKSKNTPSTLTMNIITRVFSINYDTNSNPSILENLPLSPVEAIGYARSYLEGANLLQADLKESPATAELLRVERGRFVHAVSLSEANLVKVNLFRKDLGKDKNIPSVTPDMPEANVWFLLSGPAGKEIISAEYHYYPLDENTSSTYPLKTASQAWEELRSGKTYIANLGDNKNNNIIIRKVYLAYYDAGQYTEFYQPVIVFKGDNNFYAYVPAVTDKYYGAE